MASNPFGPLGAWIPRNLPELLTLTPELERLGYDTVWLAGGVSAGVLEDVEQVLEATESIKVATGIVNIWCETPESITSSYLALEARFPGRTYVGLGVSHAPLVDTMTDQTYARPLAAMREFLDGLDRIGGLPKDRRLLAALGPKMVALAAERTLGSHPYLVTVENVAAVRSGIGDGIIAAELGVVLDEDLVRARQAGRDALELYFGLPNYTNNWMRSPGLVPADLEGRSDRLMDEILALGDLRAIAARVGAMRDAGADHICLQVVGPVPHGGATFEALAGL
jgi:probable F420-dependent oxidoreductase